MMMPRILAFAGSLRRDSFNKKLVSIAARGAREAGAEVMLIAERWSIESIEPVQVEVRPDLKDLSFSEGGPKAWFVVVRRTGV